MEFCDSQNIAQRTCVILPTFNNARTIASVLESVISNISDVIVVNDGSTDGTTKILESFSTGTPGVIILTHEFNRGKGAALQTGFRHAYELGFTHAITMDADGQHRATDLSQFLEAIERNPTSIIVGKRGLHGAGRPLKSRILRAHSNFWVWVETGVWVSDTQSGFRAYPLVPISKIILSSKKYDYEVEVLVRLMWSGVTVKDILVDAFYGEGSESHFRPLYDFALVARLNLRLFLQRLLVPLPILNFIYSCDYSAQPYRQQFSRCLGLLATCSTYSPGTLAMSVSVGVIMGILPLWGFQALCALSVAYFLRLNKLVAVIASNVSFPAAIPFIVYASLLFGRLLLTGTLDLALLPNESASALAWQYFSEYLVGAVVLAGVTGIVSGLMVYFIAKILSVWRARARS